MAFRVNHALASFMCNVYHRAATKENRAHTFPSWFTLLYGISTKFGLFVVWTRFLYANKKKYTMWITTDVSATGEYFVCMYCVFPICQLCELLQIRLHQIFYMLYNQHAYIRCLLCVQKFNLFEYCVSNFSIVFILKCVG